MLQELRNRGSPSRVSVEALPHSINGHGVSRVLELDFIVGVDDAVELGDDLGDVLERSLPVHQLVQNTAQ